MNGTVAKYLYTRSKFFLFGSVYFNKRIYTGTIFILFFMFLVRVVGYIYLAPNMIQFYYAKENHFDDTLFVRFVFFVNSSFNESSIEFYCRLILFLFPGSLCEKVEREDIKRLYEMYRFFLYFFPLFLCVFKRYLNSFIRFVFTL